MDINRKTAYEVLLDVEKNGAYSNITLNNLIEKNKPDNPPFVRELVYGVLKNKLLLDYDLKYFIPTGFSKLKAKDLCILRMGAYQLLFMGSVPEYAAVSESVDLAKTFIRGKERFVNGVLRSMASDRLKLKEPDPEADPYRYLSIMYSVEPWIAEILHNKYGFSKSKEILEKCQETPNLSIRVNNIKSNRDEVKNFLESYDKFEVEKSDIVDRTLYVKGPSVLNTKEFKDGLFTVQDEASTMAALALDAKPGDFVIDVCAAPGGKTTAIAECMNNEGKILALDYYENKLGLIEKACDRLGITIVETKANDAKKTIQDLVGKADRVLADVPCSGLGVIRRKPEIRYKDNSDLEELIDRQRKILIASAMYLKRGGTLVYSTCTINPDENERQIKNFLDKYQDFTKIEEHQYTPLDGTDGFYIAKIRRN